MADDLQPLVTRCPDCATQFRVSEAQLQVAHGKVRCGSCLTVFQGVDNLVWDSQSDAEQPNAADVTLDDLLQELTDDSAPGSPPPVASTFSPPNFAEPYKPPRFGDPKPAQPETLEEIEPSAVQALDIELVPSHPDTPPIQDRQPDEPQAAESQAPEPQVSMSQASVDDANETAQDEDQARAQRIIAAAEQQSQPTRSVLKVEFIEVPAEQDLVDLGANYIGPDYASLNRSPEEREEIQRISRNRREAMAEMRAIAQEQAALEAAELARQQAASVDLAAASDVAQPTASEEAPAMAASLASTPQVAANVVSTESVHMGRSWRTPAIAAAVLLLVAQILYFQFDDWAVEPGVRPVYQAACQVLGCQLPHRRDFNLLKSRNLKVRSHPDEPGQLLVDALIVNEAEFDQPFPNLHLRFANVDGKPMADVVFTPADYLAGELAGATMMAARTPVHIAVDVPDPGPQALSYTLSFQ